MLPSEGSFDDAEFLTRLDRQPDREIGAALLDQSIAAGIGNDFSNRCGIHSCAQALSCAPTVLGPERPVGKDENLIWAWIVQRHETPMLRSNHSLLILSVCSLVGLGCASTASAKPLSRKVGERVTRGVVDESLSSLDTAENRRHIGNLVGSPEMTRAAHALSASIAEGAVDGVMRAASGDAEALAASAGPAIEKNLDEHVTPALRRMTSKVVTAAISASLAEQNQRNLGDLTEQTTHRAMTGLASGIDEELGPALAVTLKRDLGPALAVVIERDLLPAVGRGLAGPEMQAAVGNISSSMVSEAVISSEEAIDEIQAENARTGEDSSLEIFGTNVALGFAISVVVAAVSAAGFLFMMIALIRTRRRMQSFEESGRRTDKMLQYLARNENLDDIDLS